MWVWKSPRRSKRSPKSCQTSLCLLYEAGTLSLPAAAPVPPLGCATAPQQQASTPPVQDRGSARPAVIRAVKTVAQSSWGTTELMCANMKTQEIHQEPELKGCCFAGRGVKGREEERIGRESVRKTVFLHFSLRVLLPRLLPPLPVLPGSALHPSPSPFSSCLLLPSSRDETHRWAIRKHGERSWAQVCKYRTEAWEWLGADPRCYPPGGAPNLMVNSLVLISECISSCDHFLSMLSEVGIFCLHMLSYKHCLATAETRASMSSSGQYFLSVYYANVPLWRLKKKN